VTPSLIRRGAVAAGSKILPFSAQLLSCEWQNTPSAEDRGTGTERVGAEHSRGGRSSICSFISLRASRDYALWIVAYPSRNWSLTNCPAFTMPAGCSVVIFCLFVCVTIHMQTFFGNMLHQDRILGLTFCQ